MRKRIISITLNFCLLIVFCVPVLASDVSQAATPIGKLNYNAIESESEHMTCGHILSERFLDSDECVQCFEEKIIEEYTNIPATCGSLCPSCGKSSLAITCARSNIIDKSNYQKGTSYLCTGCKNKTCSSPCYVLQYLSYAKNVCGSCGYSAYLVSASGTGLAKHYCGVYDYCSGKNYYIYCDLNGDKYEV